MPVQLTWEDHGLFRRYSGDVTSELLVRVKEANLGGERFDRLLYTVCDFSDVGSFCCRKQDLDYLGALDKGTALYRPLICVASVTTDECIAAPMRSLRDSGVSSYPRGVFGTVGEARAWITSRLREQGFTDFGWKV